jgi:O-antigen/teichoic acid export membrane protein
MDIQLASVAVAILAVIARLLWALRRRDPLGETVTLALIAGLSAAALMVGICVAPYPIVAKYQPTSVAFYRNWLSDPLFICFAGIAYALLGLVSTIRVFQQKKA